MFWAKQEAIEELQHDRLLLDFSKIWWLIMRLNKHWDRLFQKDLITKGFNSEVREMCQK